MLPLAMNWTFDSFHSLNLTEVWVFFDVAGDKDYLFIPHTDEEMTELIGDLTSDADLDDESRLIIELSMLARSDPFFVAEALNGDMEDYTAEKVLSMEFYVDRPKLSDEQYFATRMSMDIRKARGWNTAVISKLYLPPEHFLLMMGKLPSTFGRGSIAAWDTRKYGFPIAWSGVQKGKVLEFSRLIMSAITTLREEATESSA